MVFMNALSFIFYSIFYFDFSNRIIKYQKSCDLFSFYIERHLYRHVHDLINTINHLLCPLCYKNYHTKHLLCYVQDKVIRIKQLLCHTFQKINTTKQSLCHILETGITAKQMLHHSYFIIYDIKYFFCPVYDMDYVMNDSIHHIYSSSITFIKGQNFNLKSRRSMK